jgi:hypothetical protein
MEIVKEVKSLELPDGQYVVFGSGPMQVHGIRESDDIDILVLPELYKSLKQQGWPEKRWKPPYPSDYLYKGNFQIVYNWNYGEYNPDPEQLIEQSEIIQGIPFARLEEVLRWKRVLGREKDQRDIKLIEEYLKNEH